MNHKMTKKLRIELNNETCINNQNCIKFDPIHFYIKNNKAFLKKSKLDNNKQILDLEVSA